MIFQEPMTALNPVLTVGDQIDEVLRIHTRARARASAGPRWSRSWAPCACPSRSGSTIPIPHQISGGQRQRVMIAAALVLDPALLIADEPTTALDVTTQAQILRLIKDLQRRRGTGVLFITHDFGVVAEVADRVAVMQRGRIVEEGPADEVLRRPQADYTRMLIAAVPSLDPKPRQENTGAVALETVELSKTYGGAGLFGGGRTVRAAERRLAPRPAGRDARRRRRVRLRQDHGGPLHRPPRDADGRRHPPRRRRTSPLCPSGSSRPQRRRVQIVFQDPYRSLNPRRTVGASIVEGPINFGLPRPEALSRARSLMGLVGLAPDALDRFPHQFSGGQRQRIAIARALAMEPEVLIADEAVSALDVSVQAQVLDLLDDVKRRFDLAMLFITHDLRVAAQICDRIAVMERGLVVEHGPTYRVFSRPGARLHPRAPRRRAGAGVRVREGGLRRRSCSGAAAKLTLPGCARYANAHHSRTRSGSTARIAA